MVFKKYVNYYIYICINQAELFGTFFVSFFKKKFMHYVNYRFYCIYCTKNHAIIL